MGVEFFPCDACDETICDAGPMFRCEKCSSRFHVECVGKPYVEVEDLSFDEDDDRRYTEREATSEERCPVCTLEVIPVEDLLDFALDKLKISHEELTKEYVNSKQVDK